jgi:hypothetical protein
VSLVIEFFNLIKEHITNDMLSGV